MSHGIADKLLITPLDGQSQVPATIAARQQYPLQPVIMPSGDWPAELYFRIQSFWKPTRAKDGTLHLPKGCVLDFDTLTNCFFEGHWVEWTGHGASALNLIIKGAAEVHVRRTSVDASGEDTTEEVATARTDADQNVLSIPIPPAKGSSASSRLSFQIGTSDADAFFALRGLGKRSARSPARLP